MFELEIKLDTHLDQEAVDRIENELDALFLPVMERKQSQQVARHYTGTDYGRIWAGIFKLKGSWIVGYISECTWHNKTPKNLLRDFLNIG